MKISDEKLVILLTVGVIVQVPMTLFVYYMLTNHLVPYVVFCEVVVLATYLYLKKYG